MRYHWSYLRELACESQSRIGRWANKPDFVDVREQILRLPQSEVAGAPIDASEEQRAKCEPWDESRYRDLLDNARRLIELTRAWDSKVRGSWKVQYYESSYDLEFQDFKNHARDDSLLEFFHWADQCADCGFGLVLDY
jgi:hypothetical protein